MCKELPVILVNRAVDKKRIIAKIEGRGGGEAQGIADQKTTTGWAPFLGDFFHKLTWSPWRASKPKKNRHTDNYIQRDVFNWPESSLSVFKIRARLQNSFF
jgi:hypothetical protein